MEIGRDYRRNRKALCSNFLSGLLIGVLIVMPIGSFIVAWKSQRAPPTYELTNFTDTTTEESQEPAPQLQRIKRKVFVGVQTGFSKDLNNPKYIYELRREQLRNTWFPKSQEEIDKWERDQGIVIRFVMGHSDDPKKEEASVVEEQTYGSFLRLNMKEGYSSLPDKTLLFLKTVMEKYDVDYILKVDDDVYFRLDRVLSVSAQWSRKKSDYVGCMKRGPVITNPTLRWHEPQHSLIGNTYYTHAWGTVYAVSWRIANILVQLPVGALRFMDNEDTSLGAWMLGLNATHFDDRRLCSAYCTETSVAVYDIPNCSGLCDPQGGLAQLDSMADCKSPAVPYGQDSVPMEPEMIPVDGILSRKTSLVLNL